MKAIASVVILALAGSGAVYYMTGDGEGANPGTVESSGSPDSTPEQPDAMQVGTEEPKRKKELPRKHRLYFPDGSYLPALNGATNAKPVVFRDRPYAPVIGKKKDSSGRQWYEHEDGSFSTTFMGYRKDLGRMDAITQVANPTEPRPLLVEDPGLVGPGGISPPKKGGAGKGKNAGK